MISIIIPAYNNLAELKITLLALHLAMKELIRSTGLDVEVILSDDGSQDGTGKWISNTYPEIQYCWHENLGRGPNRNFGAAKAMGDQLIFLDSDVAVETHSLNALLFPLLNNRADIIFGNIRLFQGVRSSPLTVYLSHKWEKLMQRFGDNLDPWDSYSGFFALPKVLFDKLEGFSTQFEQYGGEDTDFFLRCSQQNASLFFVEDAIGWHHQPLDLRSNLQRIYWQNYSAAQMPFPAPDRIHAENTIDRRASKKEYLFWFITRNKLWSRFGFLDRFLRFFPPDSRAAFYFYHFLFWEYAEKGYCDGKRLAV